MTIAVETTEGLVEFSDAFIGAIARRAEFVASLVGETILRAALDFPQPPTGNVHQLNVPAAFLLELGAVLVLELWERHGITAHRDVGFPSWRDADADLALRLNEDPTQFNRLESASLSQRVLRFWVENFTWDGVATFRVDVILSSADEDAMVDAVAHFLWDNRKALSATQPNREQR
jgi:hypothetical protein